MRREVLAETGLAGAPIIAVGGHDHIVGALATGLNDPGSVINSIGTAEALLLATEKPLDDPEIASPRLRAGRDRDRPQALLHRRRDAELRRRDRMAPRRLPAILRRRR